MRLYLLILLLLTSGCATMGKNSLVSPSESKYYRATEYYELGAYDSAILLYVEFIEAKPRHDLTPAAKLNLGMAHYYSEEYKKAYDVLKEIIIKDENIKKYVNDIVKICQTKAKDEIEAEEKPKTSVAEAQTTTEVGEVEITITDAFVDNFGSVTLMGSVSESATIIIDNKSISSDSNNQFTATAFWIKGDAISISAEGKGGNVGELNYFPDGESPDEPENLRTINITENSIEIEWDENSEDDVKGYRLFYRAKGGSLHEVPDLIMDTKHEVVGLAGRTSNTIEFYLRAVDKMNNESEDSDILEADLL